MRLGIDIDTHVARAAVLGADGKPQLLASLPALARQTMHGLVVGQEAAQALAGNAETTVCGCTRLMGRAGKIPAALAERLPYAIRQVNGEALCNLLYAEVPASEIYARLTCALVEVAKRRLGQGVDELVLTVPASAQDRFRVQARAAVEAQGLSVRRLVNQPTAALLATQLPDSAHRVAVVHCGGASTDVSLALRYRQGVRILATAGDMTLGGDDLAWAVAEGLDERFSNSDGVDVFAVDDGRVAAWGLRAAAEKALQELCLTTETKLVLDHGGGFGRDLMTIVQRADVANWLSPLLKRVSELCTRALAASELTPQHIDAVLMTGDWAHLPALVEQVANAFQQPTNQLYVQDAALLPVYGAALAAADDAKSVWDVTPFALGINCHYNDVELFSPIIVANTPIPTPSINAPGAFIRNYQTLLPDQTSVTLDILQYRGERDPDPCGPDKVKPNECEVLGSWDFAGLGPKKGQHAPFTVTFAVDADGILHLYAKETQTGHDLQAQVDGAIG